MNYEEEYLVLSAEYCEELFRASHLFFLANVNVEYNAKQRDLANLTPYSFKETFAKMAERSDFLFTKFLDYASIHLVRMHQHKSIFDEQKQTLKQLSLYAHELALKIKKLNEGQLLQEQLWSDNEYTDLFTQCSLLICKANTWQCNLARLSNLTKESTSLCPR